MKKKLALIMVAVLLMSLSACGGLGASGDENRDTQSQDTNIQDTNIQNSDTDGASVDGADVEESTIINPEGSTLETRFSTPEGYTRVSAEAGSLTAFLRNYELKEDGAAVLLFNGNEKGNQYAHVAVFTLPLGDYDLQQCADSVMRVWAEYYYSTGQYDKIKFYFTNGFLCEYSKWIQGYRVVVEDSGVYWNQSAGYDDSYETFESYLQTVFCYAGTLSMDTYEAETISLADMDVGDVILKGGSPGHVVMVVDVCGNESGEKAFLFAQGYMPAQEFHVIKNPTHDQDPWYYESEMTFPLRTAEYTFDDASMIQRLCY